MVKKATLIMIICMLLVSACVFVSCKEEPLAPPASQKKERAEVENTVGTPGENLVEDLTDIKEDGSTLEIAAGAGYSGGDAIIVTQTATYGEVVFDLTPYYGSGKSYYVEAWYKNNGSTREDDPTAYVSFSIVTGSGYDATGQTYDIDGQYDGDWMDNDEALDFFELETNSGGADISDGAWHKVSAVLDAENIEKVMLGEDSQNNGDGDPTMYLLSIVFFVGKYPNQDGYIYYLSDIVVKDLNTELEVEGKTYEAPEEDEGE